MMNKRLLIIAIVLLAGILGCSDDDPIGPGAGVSGGALLGLIHGHTLEYFQTDSITTYVDDGNGHLVRTVSVINQVVTISIIQEGDNWIIREGADKVLNLKISGPYVINNGYYDSDTLIYFQIPAKVMKNTIVPDQPWSSAFESFAPAADSSSTPFYFTYFGFHFSKTYEEIEEVLVPSGVYYALRFEVDLFLTASDVIPSAHVTEYFAPNVGLVKLRFEDGGFVRTLSLRESL